MQRTIAIAAAVLALAIAFRLAPASAGGNPARSDPPESIAYAGTLLVQLRSSDLERSIAFYRDVLGLKVKERNEALKWVKFDPGLKGVTIGVGEGPDVQGSGTTSINSGVVDVDKARALLESRGVPFTRETITIPDVVKLADLTDPDGNRIRLAQSLADED